MFKIFRKNSVSNPPWNYYFLLNLEKHEYPMYLAKLFYLNTGEKLPLEWSFKSGKWRINKKRCKTFNQKIQWIKLYGVTDLMRDCTDKVKVRDYVKEKIGEEYLKPVLQVIPENTNEYSQPAWCPPELVSGADLNNNQKMLKHACIDDDIQSKKINRTAVQHDRLLGALQPNFYDVSNYFDKIEFDKLPNSFVIKCNHGCKWHYIIKDKNLFLTNKRLFEIVKRNMTGWLEQDYSFWNGFELQYRKIKPKILIETLLRDEINTPCQAIQVYCFCGIPQIIIWIHNKKQITIYNNNFKIFDDLFDFSEYKVITQANDLIKKSVSLSTKLCSGFNFVRIDWMIHTDNLYLEELTFTPYSGFYKFKNLKNEIRLGNFINLK